MLNNIYYLNCRSCGRQLRREKFKSGYCSRCLRGRIAAVQALYNEAIRMIGQAKTAGVSSLVWGESLAFCMLAAKKIKKAETECGQPLIGDDDLSNIEAFLIQEMS